MKAIFVKAEDFDRHFQTSLDKLKLVSLQEGTINVNLNDQVLVSRFISDLHRRFHYEVCMLKDRLEKEG